MDKALSFTQPASALISQRCKLICQAAASKIANVVQVIFCSGPKLKTILFVCLMNFLEVLAKRVVLLLGVA